MFRLCWLLTLLETIGHTEPSTHTTPDRSIAPIPHASDMRYCAAIRRQFESSTPTQQRPNWFIRPFPTQMWGGYAGDSKNYLIDLLTKKEIPIAGSYDPVPTPDEKLLTVPKDGSEVGGMRFYSLPELLKKGTKATPIPVLLESGIKEEDTELQGVYQSIGILTEGAEGQTYRVITSMGSPLPGGKKSALTYRDYQTDFTPEGNVMKPVGATKSKPLPLCTNYTEGELALPMLSKDGKSLAALDLKGQPVTKIFKILDDGKCEEKMSLGMSTGKVDFNYGDGKYAPTKITFHKYNSEQKSPGDFISVPSDSLVSNVYTYDLRSREIKRLTYNTNSNAVYPAFRKDGTIVYLSHPHQAKDLPQKKAPSKLMVIKPDNVQGRTFDFMWNKDRMTPNQKKLFHSMAALGSLWSEICSPFASNAGAETAVLNAMLLELPEDCRSMVKKHWTRLRDKIRSKEKLLEDKRIEKDTLNNLQEEDLLAACDRTNEDRTPNTPTPPPPDNRGANPLQSALRKCVVCHDGVSNIPAIDFSSAGGGRAPQSRISTQSTLRTEIARRLEMTGDGKMPPNGAAITAEEKKALLERVR